ncbi:MAG: hypothetical protein SGARI_005931, partial [Bacillariaceae sp.]
AIESGRAYQHDHFLDEDQVLQLLKEIKDLENEEKFITKGLSNTSDKAQQFSARQDRSICPVPWFIDALSGTFDATTNRLGIPHRLQQLQLELSQLLERPTMADASLNHECYYSLSKVGSFLPRHMDERHEEMKGTQGWLMPSRRSLSWLIYLSEPADWDITKNGGALRTFPQQHAPSRDEDCTHDGNLQVAWMEGETSGKRRIPVYMDSFYLPPETPKGMPDSYPEPYCILYTVSNNGQEKECITRPWLTEALQGMAVPDFIQACALQDASANDGDNSKLLLFASSKHARQFYLLEDRQSWNDGNIPRGSVVDDIAPVRGRLVVFDSVRLPHEVREIHSGTRRALAGWFHEKTQELKL